MLFIFENSKLCRAQKNPPGVILSRKKAKQCKDYNQVTECKLTAKEFYPFLFPGGNLTEHINFGFQLIAHQEISSLMNCFIWIMKLSMFAGHTALLN